MKRGIDIATILFGIWAGITGITGADFHGVISILFAVLFCAHAFLYKKLLLGHLRGLGWKWLMVGAVLTVLVSTSFLWGGDGFELDTD